MMKFNVGYQITRSTDFLQYIIEHKDRIHEVYFSWGDFANGRSRMERDQLDLYSWEVQQKQMADLALLHENGIGLDLLLNATCYGRDSQSRAFFNKVGETVSFLQETYGLGSVTTTSPLIAKFLKNNFEGICVRASVNMEIGSVGGMKYLTDYFDSFYMKREYNRNRRRIEELTSWCRENGKELLVLANSGCLNNCSAHMFHDNLVSHEAEIAEMDNAYDFHGICWEHLKKEAGQSAWLSDTNFIRPEDIPLYDRYFSVAKLATRTNSAPLRVLRAYMEGHYTGAATELLEPNHSGVFYPRYVENGKIPQEFAAHVLDCDKACDRCGYCARVQESATVTLEEIPEIK